MTEGPIRALTRRQAEIAHGIGRNLSYREIGDELQLREQTIAGYVKAMALIFDSKEDLPPRVRIFVWVKQFQWDCEHEPTVDELMRHSVEARKRYMDSLHGAGVAGLR